MSEGKHQVHVEVLTLTLSRMVAFPDEWSPVYTTQIALGQLSCVALIAAHNTRSPPPPALLFLISYYKAKILLVTYANG